MQIPFFIKGSKVERFKVIKVYFQVHKTFYRFLQTQISLIFTDSKPTTNNQQPKNHFSSLCPIIIKKAFKKASISPFNTPSTSLVS